jgi:hypothetical protein
MDLEAEYKELRLTWTQRLLRSFREISWDDRHNRNVFFARIGVMISVGIFVLVNAMTGMALPNQPVQYYWDALFNASESVNLYLQSADSVRNALLICSSLLVDFLAVTFACRFLVFGVSWRSVLCLLMFYSFRAFVQVRC